MVSNADQWLNSLIEHADRCQADRTAEAEELESARRAEEPPGQNDLATDIQGAAGEPSA
jgi:hypothetical protein